MFRYLFFVLSIVLANDVLAAAGWSINPSNTAAYPCIADRLAAIGQHWGSSGQFLITDSTNSGASGNNGQACYDGTVAAGTCAQLGVYSACTVAPVTNCTLPAVLNTTTNLCETPPIDCTAGQSVSTGYYDVGTADTGLPPTTACDSQCVVNYSGSGVVATHLVSGAIHYFTNGNYTKSGATCSTGSGSPAATASLGTPSCTSPEKLNLAGDACISDPNPDSVCPSGQVKIGFLSNGDPICQTASTAPPIDCPTGYLRNSSNTACYKPVTSCPTGQTAVANLADGNFYCVSNEKTCLQSGTCTSSDSAGQVMAGSSGSNPIPSGGDANVDAPEGAVSGVGNLNGSDLDNLPDSNLIPQEALSLNYADVGFAQANGCPAPITFNINMPFVGGNRTFSYQPLCDVALMVRPIFLALGAIASAFIFVAGFVI